MKKEELNYFDGFLKMSNYAVEISKVLKAFMLAYNYEEAKEKEKKVHEHENNADRTQHEILNYLIKDFVPPIDREDIINVTRRLDDVIDNIDEVAIDLDILAVETLREDIPKYLELLEVATNKMYEMFTKFKDMKDYETVKKIAVALNGVEEQGDKLFQHSIRDLYTNEKDSVEVIRWTAIYNRFEDCFDSIEHVAECVDEIFMKNS